jgi:adenylate cyclase
MAKLIIRAPQVPEVIHELQALNTIGRHPGQNIQVLDRIVSKEHAIITFSDGFYWIQDIGSRNGTFVNELVIPGRQKLNEGDVIRLGETTMTFKEDRVNQSMLISKTQIHFQNDAEFALIRSSESATSLLDIDYQLPATQQSPEVLKKAYDQFKTILSLQESLSGIVEVDKVLFVILEEASKLLKASRGAVFLMEKGELVPRASKIDDRKRNASSEALMISKTILNRVVETKKGVVFDNATSNNDFEESHSILINSILSAICVPLLDNQNNVVGVMYLDNTVATKMFQDNDLNLMMLFAQRAAGFVINARLIEEEKKRQNLSRLLSPNIVKQIVSQDLDVQLGGISREVTVLFADIRGFTKMSEKVSPPELITLLNSYFEFMVEKIFQYDGTLDKFIGDEIMAIWGAPFAQTDHRSRALKAVIEMRKALETFNISQQSAGLPTLQVGYGLNAGVVVAGYVGSTQTMSYTVLGDAVNVASRLCSKAMPGEILVSSSIYEHEKESFDFEHKDPILFKGKSAELPVYQVVANKELPDGNITPIPPGML